jgi:hypothetical protein
VLAAGACFHFLAGSLRCSSSLPVCLPAPPAPHLPPPPALPVLLLPCSTKFEQLVKGLLDRTVQPCHSCMKDAGVNPADIQEVLLVGGMSRMPKVSKFGWPESYKLQACSSCLVPKAGSIAMNHVLPLCCFCNADLSAAALPSPALLSSLPFPCPAPAGARHGSRHLQEGAQQVHESRRGARYCCLYCCPGLPLSTALHFLL